MTGLATAPRRLGVITIGQTPRPDLQAVFAAAAPGVDVVVDGALDTCRPGELTALATEGPYPLLVRLADGSTREVPRDRLVPYVAQAAGRLAAGGATLVVLACAGEFPALASPVPLVVPGRVVPAAVRRLAAGRRLGIVTPNAAQRPFADAKWRADGFEVSVTHAAPGHSAELAAAAARLRDAAAELVLLDCMGHDEASRAAMARLSGLPTLAVQGLVADLAGALV